MTACLMEAQSKQITGHFVKFARALRKSSSSSLPVVDRDECVREDVGRAVCLSAINIRKQTVNMMSELATTMIGCT